MNISTFLEFRIKLLTVKISIFFFCSKISFGICGRFTGAELLSFSMALTIVCVWILTGHWLLMDGKKRRRFLSHGHSCLFVCFFFLFYCAIIHFYVLFFPFFSAMGMGLCVAFIAFVRLPSLKVSTLLLTGLLVYDVFWVFFSSYIFNANVMVKVATRPADNPVGVMAKKFHFASGMARDAPKLSLPGKLVFPSMHNVGHFSMLGLGDIVMPGLLLCFVLRYDAYKKSQLLHSAETGVPPPNHFNRITYFHCSLIGYFLGLLTATVSSEFFKAAQPALLYLVPFTLLPLLVMAYLKVNLDSLFFVFSCF